MRKQFSILFSIIIFESCSLGFNVIEEPTDYSIVINRSRVTGVIFSENAECLFCNIGEQRFSPSVEDIELAEQILEANLKENNNLRLNQVDGCPIIHKHLKSYRRQYFGFYNESGERVLFVTFNWNKRSFPIVLIDSYDKIFGQYQADKDNWKREREVVMDGCSYHWEIKINLENKELFDLEVNG